MTLPDLSFIKITSSPVSSDMLKARIRKPNRERIADLVVEHPYFGHIFVPSFIASVGYAVIRKPS
jgi:hypothetical protein